MCLKVFLQFASLFFLHLLLLINNHSALDSKSNLSFLSVGDDNLRPLGSFGWDLAETFIKETAQLCDDASREVPKHQIFSEFCWIGMHFFSVVSIHITADY